MQFPAEYVVRSKEINFLPFHMKPSVRGYIDNPQRPNVLFSCQLWKETSSRSPVLSVGRTLFNKRQSGGKNFTMETKIQLRVYARGGHMPLFDQGFSSGYIPGGSQITCVGHKLPVWAKNCPCGPRIARVGREFPVWA